ncbi:MAG TPA: amidohydrolase family protein [Xanthobacteraceae bacterium]|nr:amidohydrolase family protein [Xanthobacteraceae bacterium]
MSRRDFLAGSAAASALGMVGASTNTPPAAAQAPAKPRRIDVHHHFVPPVHAEALARHKSTAAKWSVEASLSDMDKAGVDTAVVSILNPGVWFGQIDEEARTLARACNEYAANLERDHKGKFRSFAVIPLPDTEGSLREIEYALDVLKAQGIALWTSYSDKYLGDPAFLPVFEELNRRKAVVYTHPTVPDCCSNLVKGVPVSTLEYAHDTTRTIASLVFGEGNTALKCPDIKFIWSHSGGTLPFLTSRFVELANRPRDKERFPNGPLPIFGRFYYEIAQGNTRGQLAALMEMVKISQVMFGSDYPFRKGIDAVQGEHNFTFTPEDISAIDSENAIRVMPGLQV